MRILILFALLASFLLVFIGCQDSGGEANMFPVSASVTTTTGIPINNANVTLAENGTTIQTFPATGTEGRSTLPRVRNVPGLTLTVSPTDTYPRTIYGPLNVNQARTFTIPVYTFTQLQTDFDVTPPTNDTATLVVFGFANAATTNTPIPVTVQVDNGPIIVSANPVVYPNISVTTTHTIKVTDPATGQILVFRNVSFTANTITVLEAVFAESPNVTLTGQVFNAVTDTNEANADVTLFRRGLEAGTATTNAQGGFTFTNLLPSDGYSVLITSPTNSFVRTIFVQPVTIQDKDDGQFGVLTQAQLQSAFPTITTPPNADTAVVTALGFNNETDAGNLTNPIPLTLNIDSTDYTGAPPVASGIPGTFTITITDAANDRTFILPDVTLPGGQITVIRIPNVNDLDQI